MVAVAPTQPSCGGGRAYWLILHYCTLGGRRKSSKSADKPPTSSPPLVELVMPGGRLSFFVSKSLCVDASAASAAAASGDSLSRLPPR